MRVISVENTKELEDKREDYIRSGYHISSSGPDYVRLTNRYYGSTLLHVILFLISLGVLNVIYLIYRTVVGGDDVDIRVGA